jgi:hypothetical protein
MNVRVLVRVTAVLALAMCPSPARAKPVPSVMARLETLAPAVRDGDRAEVILHLTATADAPDVTAEVLAPPG